MFLNLILFLEVKNAYEAKHWPKTSQTLMLLALPQPSVEGGESFWQAPSLLILINSLFV